MGFFKEFREFAVKGNVVDLAVGVIIGTAFNKIVSSAVKDVIMPPIGIILGRIDLSDYKWVLQKAEVSATGELVQEQVSINIGHFTQACLDFIIIAFIVFLIVKLINKTKRRAEDTKDNSVPTPKDIQLLTEIRDELRKQAQNP
jgi:large conductance mechanosensitive channel